jgi:bifunctional N-acetylglucosamine-1-phosphate-uridyltransferase/glucosamine-1-phosphate-acetyltransferase GlmU-like protein
MHKLWSYVPNVRELMSDIADEDAPWDVVARLPELLASIVSTLSGQYEQEGDCFIHKTAIVHESAILQDTIIVGPGASIGPHAILRGGVWLSEGAHIGGSCEIKQSFVGPRSGIAHLNYVGNSIIGCDVNIEAGAVLANHFNERLDKTIWVEFEGKRIRIRSEKFGALVGDKARIGANAVTSPGTILIPGTIVGRLELVQQA